MDVEYPSKYPSIILAKYWIRKRGVLMGVYEQLIINGILTGGVFAIIAVGLTLVFGVMNIINFAHGEFLMIAMYLTYWMNVKMGMDPFVGILIIFPIMFIIGIAVYKITLNPIINSREELTILMTVAIMIFLQNLALMLWSADVRSLSISYSSSTIALGSSSLSLTKIASFAVTILMSVGLMVFLNRTWLGRSIKAISQNRDAAKLMGVDTVKTYMYAFGIGIGTVGIAGAALSTMYGIYPLIGQQFGTVAFVVVVLGGLGNIPGAIIGGLLIGIVDAISGFLLPVGFNQAVYLMIFIAVLLLRPNGILGKAKAGGGR
jgi:Branched-chain amino acid ABC-type transport system, permease components